jgi:hypothetical protein
MMRAPPASLHPASPHSHASPAAPPRQPPPPPIPPPEAASGGPRGDGACAAAAEAAPFTCTGPGRAGVDRERRAGRRRRCACAGAARRAARVLECFARSDGRASDGAGHIHCGPRGVRPGSEWSGRAGRAGWDGAKRLGGRTPVAQGAAGRAVRDRLGRPGLW